ncbi:MAG: hypothetical protein KDK91_31090, partial [Gammaproteobacteria bacterium]|nr:hypothetical protein [Gammaproteobacteria bacterium]
HSMNFKRFTAVALCIATFFGLAATPSFVGAQGAVNIGFSLNLDRRMNARADAALRTNVVAYAHEYISHYIWDKFFTEQRVGDLLLDTTSITRDSSSLEDIKRRMRSLDKLVRETIARGGRVQLVFQSGIPKWLSSDPHNEGSLFEGSVRAGEKIWQSVPPADYGQWQQIAYEFVHHFNNELNTNGRVYYVVGNEPGNYWVGSEQDFHQYYKSFALGALRADPNVKVGGINPSNILEDRFSKHPAGGSRRGTQFQAMMTRDNKPMVYNWLQFAASEKLPVRVVAWHDYPAASPVPSQTANWVVAERLVRGWLAEFGFSGVELILNDWPEWKPVANENDSEFQAAYVASGLISMVETGSVKPIYLGLMDISAFTKPSKGNASFAGGTGLFTRVGLAKPVYNTYALLSKMQGQLVQTRTGDEFVTGLATVQDDAVYLLLVNFIPSKRLIPHNSYGIDGGELDDRNKAALKNALNASGMNRQDFIKSLVNGTIPVQSLGLPSEANKKVSGAVAVARAALQRARQIAQVSVDVSGLRANGGRWAYEEYVIDDSHANSYSARGEIASHVQSLDMKQDREKLMKIREVVNSRTSVDAARVKNESVTLQGSSFNIRTSLKPNAVHLIVLRRATGG